MNILESTDFIHNQGWCWFQDPRAVYYNGNTYVAGVNASGDLLITQYNHSTERKKQYPIAKNFQDDDHAAPSIQIKPDGKIIVWFAAHYGSKLWYRISVNAEDISAFSATDWVDVGIGDPYTYTHPVFLPNEGNKTYQHWRGKNATPSLSTTQDFATWSPRRQYFSAGIRPYAKIVGDNDNTIHYFMSHGHPVDHSNNSLYHFYYRAGNWYKSDGTLIGTSAQLPVSHAAATKVYDSAVAGRRAWNWDIALDDTGKPVVVFASFVSQTDHRYHYAKWDGSQWNVQELCAAGGSITVGGTEAYYSGGIALDHSNPDIVFMSVQTGTNSWEIERWEWGGSQWNSQSLTPGATEHNIRPVVPRNHNGVDVIWQRGDYPGYTTYYTDLVGASD